MLYWINSAFVSSLQYSKEGKKLLIQPPRQHYREPLLCQFMKIAANKQKLGAPNAE